MSCSNGQVADLVDDDQPVAAQPGELGGELAGPVGVGEPGDPVGRGGEQDPVAVAGRGDPECGGQVGLAGSGRSEQDDVARLGEKPAGGQGGDLLADGGLGVPVELLQGLAGREPGGADAQLRPGCVAGATSRSRTAAR